MRKVIGAVLFALTGACVLLAALTLSNVFDDYKDSPDSMFIETAATVLAIGAVCAIGGTLALRSGDLPRGRAKPLARGASSPRR